MTHSWPGWLIVTAWLIAVVLASACEPSDDDDDSLDNPFVDDDDDNNDNDAADDDHDAVHDSWYTCAEVAAGMVNICQVATIDDDDDPEEQMAEWCERSEALFNVLQSTSPFWDCMGDCIFMESCDVECADACLDPPSPGVGCGGTVDAIYACNIVFVFEGNEYWVPEMDMQAVCGDLTEWPWDCYAGCIPGGCDTMLDCLNACGMPPV